MKAIPVGASEPKAFSAIADSSGTESSGRPIMLV